MKLSEPDISSSLLWNLRLRQAKNPQALAKLLPELLLKEPLPSAWRLHLAFELYNHPYLTGKSAGLWFAYMLDLPSFTKEGEPIDQSNILFLLKKILDEMPRTPYYAWTLKVFKKAEGITDPENLHRRIGLLEFLAERPFLPKKVIFALAKSPNIDPQHKVMLLDHDEVTEAQIAAWWPEWSKNTHTIPRLVAEFMASFPEVAEKIPTAYLGLVLLCSEIHQDSAFLNSLSLSRREACLQQLATYLISPKSPGDSNWTTIISPDTTHRKLSMLEKGLMPADFATWPKESLKALLMSDNKELRIKAQSSMALRPKPTGVRS